MNAQIINTPTGDELVIISRADYDALLARAEDEDAATARVIARTNGEEAFPESLWEEIEAGTHPVAAFRKYRKLTQADLAKASTISQGFISELEQTGKKMSLATLHKLARALEVPTSALIPEA